MSDLHLTSLGNLENARKVFQRMLHASPAYSEFLQNHFPHDDPATIAWDNIPLLTKANFYSIHPWKDILPRENYQDIYSVIRSSGTTNKDGSSKGFFWPKLRSQDARMAPVLQGMLKDIFKLEQRSTLMIVGLSLGSWAGGEEFSFAFKSLALMHPLKLVVFSPGNQHLEILEILEKCGDEFDQVLIALCPSAIFYLERLAKQKNIPLPMEKISFIVTGEPFPEEVRLDIQNRPNRKSDILPMLSVYGSADTGFLGFESEPLIRIRQLLKTQPLLAQKLGFSSQSIPNLYHAAVGDGFWEIINDDLVITKWQGVPLVRYNLKDRVKIFSWKGLCETFALADLENSQIWQQLAKQPIPDVLSVSGRSEGCVFLCGSNIFESMLQEIVLQSSLRKISTGAFVAWVDVKNGQQILSFQIEIQKGEAIPRGEELEEIQKEFVLLLGKQQPEFADDYEKFYRPFEGQGLRIFQFHFCEAPYLSEHPRYSSSVKRKILVDHGPL